MLKQQKWFIVFIAIIGIFILFCDASIAQEWKTANQYTLSWDAVTTKVDGNPFSSGDVIEYTVFLANSVTDPDKVNPVEVGTTAETSYVLTLNTEGKYFVGVRCDRTLVDDPDTTLSSQIAWSDDSGAALNPFGVMSFLAPMEPTGLR